MPDSRAVEDLTIEELEQVLRLRKREARLRQLDDANRRRSNMLLLMTKPEGPHISSVSFLYNGIRRQEGTLRDKLLLAIEVIAALGIVGVLIFAASALQGINQRSVAAQVENVTALSTGSPTPLIAVAVLPEGHTPPNSPGGAQPNYDEVPGYLRPVVEQQFRGPIILPTPSPGHARRITIQAINVDAPVIQGDGWEQLKQGVAQHIGTANPGQRGNMVLSAHNDIYGEIFRHLDQLKKGDKVVVQTLTQEFSYEVQYTLIVKPDKVSVMDPTIEPTLTLISCYPYLVDNQRIVVVARLIE